MNKLLECPNTYRGLEGLRAYSALGIVMMHVLANLPVRLSTNLFTSPNGIIPFFAQLVFLFMIISAFSMCCGYYNRFKNNSISLNDFYKKRYQRILPFFALLTLIDLIHTRTIDSLYESIANLTLCFNLLPNPDLTVIGVGWFLGIVFLFYLLFPFFIFLIDNKNRAWFAFLIALIFHIISKYYFFSNKFITNIFHDGWANMIYCAPYFLFGGVIFLYRDKISNIGIRFKTINLLICIVSTLLFFYFQSYLVSSIEIFILSRLMIFFIWLTYALSSNSLFLQNKITTYLGGISMEIYLSHMLLYRVVESIHLENYIKQNNLFYITTTILTILATIIFSHIVKYWLLPQIKKYHN